MTSPATQESTLSTASAPQLFGPNSAEVAGFIGAVGRLTPAQWRRVVAARRTAARVTRDSSSQSAETVRSLLRRPHDAGMPEPMAALAAALAAPLAQRGDEEVVAAWQAAFALARRRQLSALTFAAHYAPFAAVIPAALADLPPIVRRYANALKWLDASQWEAMGRPWALDRESSAALLQASLKSRARDGEEAAATSAIATAPRHLSGDAGWAAVKTAVHGGRVLSSMAELSAEQLNLLWAPLETALALRTLTEAPETEKPARPSARRAAPRPAQTAQARVLRKEARGGRAALYGPNTAEVAAFVKGVPELTPIQWLRVLDRRQLVASVTREGSDEPAAVVRSIVAAIAGTRELDLSARCTILSAVERAAYALAARGRLTDEQFRDHYGQLAEIVPPDEIDASRFARRLASLSPEEWTRLAVLAPAADVGSMSPLVNAGAALTGHLDKRTDDEVVTTWHALTGLIRRHRLSPIKFAVSYAPFASALSVTKSRSISPVAQHYVTAVGRLSAHQSSILAEPWLLADDISNALASAVADGGARPAEEAAALAALVSVPMRLTGDAGWAAAKTAAYGGRVIGARAKLTHDEFRSLWKPLERAIPSASLEPRAKTR